MKETLRILCPNGALGFAPTKEESFRLGAATRPDYYCCDAGSNDIGPVPLGADIGASPEPWQVHDIELMLLAAREQKVPMIIGSAGDTGTDKEVARFTRIVRELARKHDLPPFRLGWFHSGQPKAWVAGRMAAGAVVEGLDGRGPLTPAELEATDSIVAVAGVHPYVDLLEQGCDVIIGGRSSDAALFAAAALHEGFPADQAYYAGKVLECASFCAEPYAAKETVIGTVSHEDVKVTALHPSQRCTVASVAGHAMYERSNPFHELFAGGLLDMTECRYEQWDEKTCRVTGSRFVPMTDPYKVKLEGAGKVGELSVGIAGIRDPYSIANLDAMIGWARSQVEEAYRDVPHELHFLCYGRDGVMGPLEPPSDFVPREVGVVIKATAPTRALSDAICLMATRQLFYARLPRVKGTAGSAAFVTDGVLSGHAAYRWTMNHVIAVDDPLALFPRFRETVGG